MKDSRPLDIFSCPLVGCRLIDASAGTGKTHTITGLVLRLLLERDLPMEQILVVTYTEAATADLKSRIRQKIRDVLLALTDTKDKDDKIDEFIAQLLARQADPELVARRLSEALAAFDEAPIYTIHGFCQRLLMEYALESGSRFDQELVTDKRALLREVVADFLRCNLYDASPLFVAYVRDRLTEKALLKLAERVTGLDAVVIPDLADLHLVDSRALEADFNAAFAQVAALWPAARPQIAEIFLNGPFKRNMYKLDSIPVWFAELDSLLSASPTLELGKNFGKFTTTGVADGLKKGSIIPDQPFFAACERLADLANEVSQQFKLLVLAKLHTFITSVEVETRLRKERQNTITFDDLLRQVLAGLSGPAGSRLAAAVRERYPAALIDEFQDTDPVQYRIFSTIYARDNCFFCMIGDPKQSIYSFRGADVFAYLKATALATSRYSLDANWRSVPELVTAVNTLFGGIGKPFVLDGIDFSPVKPAHKVQDPLEVEGESTAPLKLWLTRRQPQDRADKPLAKERARFLILRAVADEIVRLLTLGRQGKALIEKEPITSQDIAILVRSNHEGRLAQKLLAERGIVSLLQGTESVYRTREARELWRLLLAIAEPGSEGGLKAALATSLIGLDGNALYELSENEGAIEYWLAACRRYHECWQQQGFIRMFGELLAEQGVRPRLLAYPDGERRLTNLLQVGELLQQAIHAQHLTMTGLLKYLAEQLADDEVDQEEQQLRLERERDSVRIVTIHRAKGLQYPVVFCPFCWEGTRLKEKDEAPVCFHDPEQGELPVLDLGSAEYGRHIALARREELSENVRLLYVALTRAIRRCYLVWGVLSSGETSALHHLLHGGVGSGGAEQYKKMTDEELRLDLLALAARCPEGISVADLPTASQGCMAQPVVETALDSRQFTGKIESGFKIASFSSLIQSRRSEDLPDYDARVGVDPVEPGSRSLAAGFASILAFPHGAGPGTFMHDLLEHLDFSLPIAGVQEDLIREKLVGYGFAPDWLPAVMAMLEQVVAMPLSRADRQFTLSAILPGERLNEMEFYFPLAAASPARLAALLKRHGQAAGAEAIARLDSATVQGFMKGFIDCIVCRQDRYYLLDWKSNFLGTAQEDYSQERLQQVMASEFYILQYLIYAVALDRHLALRLPDYSYERDFGGVYYLFLRGIDQQWGEDFGVFFDRPAASLIRDLSRLLIPGLPVEG